MNEKIDLLAKNISRQGLLLGAIGALLPLGALAKPKAPICGGCGAGGHCASGYCVNGFCAKSPDPCGSYGCRKDWGCKGGVPVCCGTKRCGRRNGGGRCRAA